MFTKGFIIFSLITGAIATTCSVVTAVDQIKNGDKRAAITGAACGKQIVEMSTEIVEDPATGKKYKKGLFGSVIELN